MVVRDVVVTRRPHRRPRAPPSVFDAHEHQHAAHVRMMDDRHRPARAFDRAALHALLRVRDRLLIGALAIAMPCMPTWKRAAFIMMNMYSRPRFSSPIRCRPRRRRPRPCRRRRSARAVGLALMPSLCSIDAQYTSLRLPSSPSLHHQELGHDEKRNALDAGGRIRRARQHQMDDVFGQIVFAVT